MIEKLLVSSGAALASALVAVAGISMVRDLTLAAHHWANAITAASNLVR